MSKTPGYSARRALSSSAAISSWATSDDCSWTLMGSPAEKSAAVKVSSSTSRMAGVASHHRFSTSLAGNGRTSAPTSSIVTSPRCDAESAPAGLAGLPLVEGCSPTELRK